MHYVVIGNGVAGIEAALTIRRRYSPKEARITVISKETDYFFSRTALMYAYMDLMKRKELEPHERSMYEKQSIDLIRAAVVDLDEEAQSIQLDDGRTLTFDRLLLAVGARARMLNWEGVKDVKEGLVHLVSMQDLDECERLTPSTKKAVVVGGGLIGIELVECLRFHGVDVTFLVREPFFWPAALAEPEGEMITEHIREHGVDIRHNEELDRVMVDSSGRVSGIRTSLDEEIPCQMLGICIGVQAQTDWLKNATSAPEVQRGIVVDASFRTSRKNVWAAGDCVEMHRDGHQPLIETIWYSARLHGELAARSMMGDEIEYRPPLFYNSSKFFEIEYTTVGQATDPPEGAKSLFRKHPTKKISQRIVYRDDGVVIGFNMLGSRWNHTVLERWVQERRTVDFVREHLREAQFDVEFGRARIEKFEETMYEGSPQ